MSTANQHKDINYYNYEFGLEKIKRVFDFEKNKNLKIIDLGCGDGRLLEELNKFGHDVAGVDINQKAITTLEQKNIKATQADLEKKLPLKNNQYDVVLLLDTLEHLVNQDGILKECNKILKPDGKLIISYPNHFDIRNRFRMLFGKGIIHWAHTQYKNAKPWQYGHIRFLLYKDLKKLLNLTGFYPKITQFNFMSGGVVPRRITPSFIRKGLLKIWPQLLTGKYVILAEKNETKENKIHMSSTPKNF